MYNLWDADWLWFLLCTISLEIGLISGLKLHSYYSISSFSWISNKLCLYLCTFILCPFSYSLSPTFISLFSVFIQTLLNYSFSYYNYFSFYFYCFSFLTNEFMNSLSYTELSLLFFFTKSSLLGLINGWKLYSISFAFKLFL